MTIHKEIIIKTKPQYTEILIALLQNIGYISFWEKSDNELITSIDKKDFSFEKLQTLIDNFQGNVSFESNDLEEENWNAIWESSYKPFFIGNEVVVKAPFHKIEKNYKYQIEITPKMTFGTGHHATTEQVMRLQLRMNFEGKKVLDFGCGTAILSILAEYLGAEYVLAIDNDHIAMNTIAENIGNNYCKKISFAKASIEDITEQNFDVILANINRNTIIKSAKEFQKKLKPEGVLIVSGFIVEDSDMVKNELGKYNFDFLEKIEKNNWVAAKFILK